jgi:hypothetical protein
LSGGEE